MSAAGRTRPGGLTAILPALRTRIPELTASVAERLEATDAPARSTLATSTGTQPALARQVADHLDFLCDHLEGCADEERAVTADAALPPEVLLQAHRVSAHVLWEALRTSATISNEVDPADLVTLATRLWRAHDLACAALEHEQPTGERPRPPQPPERREALLADLLEGRAAPAEVRDAAADLGLPTGGSYAVAVVERCDGSRGSPRALEQRMAAAGFPSAWRRDRGRCSGVVGLGAARQHALADLQAALCDAVGAGRVGVGSVVQHLGDLPVARRHADAARRSLPPGRPGVAVLEADLPAALLVSSPDLAELLTQRFLGPVLDLDDGERAPLLSTVETYAATGASATATAHAVRCHRNTVLNRIRRFEELTGRSLEAPAALLTTWLATRAHRLELYEP